MKNWVKPEATNLGFENTYSNGGHGGQHYCHEEKKWHDNGCGHSHAGVCKDPNHQWHEGHNASCCCVGLS